MVKTTYAVQQETAARTVPRTRKLSEILAHTRLSSIAATASPQTRAAICFRCQLTQANGEPVSHYCQMCAAWTDAKNDLTSARMRFTAKREKEMSLR